MKALVGTFNQENVLVGTFSVIVKSSQTFVPSSSAGPGQQRGSLQSYNYQAIVLMYGLWTLLDTTKCGRSQPNVSNYQI